MREAISSRIMRTTIDLDPSVLEGLRRRSRRAGKTLSQVASELLARSLRQEQAEQKPAPRLAWISRDLGRPHVDLEDMFWPVLLGYLRIVTHPAILPRPLNPKEATANVESLLDRPHVRTAGEPEGFWKLFRATGQDRARGNEVPDTHLATLMRQNGVRVIYTRDRGFRRFPDIDAVDPFESARLSRRR